VTTEHTLRSFDEDLAVLRGLVSTLGSTVCDQLLHAMTALLDGDRSLAEQVIETDATADTLAREIHAEVVRLIARYQAMARDLREIVAAERIASNLERIGDHAKTIAKRSIALGERAPQSLGDMLRRYADEVGGSVAAVLDAYGRQDAVEAMRVWQGDEMLDERYDDFFHRALSGMQEGREPILVGTHLLFVAKSLERIGDHTTNIAEDIRFMVTGHIMERMTARAVPRREQR
jgi:phosphate transport system protein